MQLRYDFRPAVTQKRTALGDFPKAEMRGARCALGRGRRFRTLGTRFWRPLLYQLSYTPEYDGPSGTRTLDQPVMSRLL